MANALYGKFRQSCLTPGVDMSAGTVKACLCTSAYTPSINVDQYLSSVSGILATSSAFGGKTFTLGVFDANDITFTAVAGGSTGTQVVIYLDTGVAGTSPLVALIDTATGLPVTTNGGDITVTWAANIFTL